MGAKEVLLSLVLKVAEDPDCNSTKLSATMDAIVLEVIDNRLVDIDRYEALAPAGDHRIPRITVTEDILRQCLFTFPSGSLPTVDLLQALAAVLPGAFLSQSILFPTILRARRHSLVRSGARADPHGREISNPASRKAERAFPISPGLP